ncbi:multiheme c-type cytochrome [Sulfurimonas sp.]|uniref:multiheme c-type cytochrome n=1 Tax=Sulfurimonas sp. TaxID=2022749 RepID=UPI002AB1930D|nr:multiheme c-type cytochrome [Sulfurimonas sp.]
MKFLTSLLFLLVLSLNASNYPSSKSCNECHENIYREHISSMHHKSSIFKDEVHRKVKNAVNKDKYSCAICHMPATKNLRAVMSGEEQPNPQSYRQTDGVSCFYCHQISKIYDSKAHKINFSNYKGEKKPTVFGNLKKPYESNEHNSKSNEIYKNSQVCMGCHSHKQNKLGFEVCNTKNQHDKTSDCIGCHMPSTTGTIEKEDKGMRENYVSHKFLGIHSQQMVKKAV